MLIFSNIKDFLKQRNLLVGTVGFVPTMGSLHNGHLELVQKSRASNKHTIVSIFVNPTQFGKNEDYSKYPRNLKQDIKLLENAEVDILFCPEPEEIYPPDIEHTITLCVDNRFNKILCGKYRKNHFSGVATIVLKLLNIIVPTECFLGLKDYQQYILIKNMVIDLNLNIKITGMETIRDINGLALSSRNQYLIPTHKLIAANIYIALKNTSSYVAQNNSINLKKTRAYFQNELQNVSADFKVQYLDVFNRNLKSIRHYEPSNMFMATAVYLGETRLIDNILF